MSDVRLWAHILMSGFIAGVKSFDFYRSSSTICANTFARVDTYVWAYACVHVHAVPDVF